MDLKKLYLVPWIWWYPWRDHASADLSLWAANYIHFRTTIINDKIMRDYDENWLPIYGSSSFRRYLTPLWSYCHRLRVNFHHSRARFRHWWWWFGNVCRWQPIMIGLLTRVQFTDTTVSMALDGAFLEPSE